MDFSKLFFLFVSMQIIFISQNVLSKDVESSKNLLSEDVESRTGSISWVKDQLQNIRDRISLGITKMELYSLKQYLVGQNAEEVAELEKEIESLLSNNDNFKTGDEINLQSGFSANGLQHNMFLGQKENSFGSSCGIGTSSTFFEKISIITRPFIIENTEASVTGTVTYWVTETKVLPSTVVQEEIVTITPAPKLSTSTVLLTETKFRTVETSLHETDWRTKSVHLSETQVDVSTHFRILTTNSPGYVTYTSTSYLTTLVTFTHTSVLSSAMILKETTYHEIPITVTEAVNHNVQQAVVETEFEKKMITETSVLESTVLTTAHCKKGFFDVLKKPWLG